MDREKYSDKLNVLIEHIVSLVDPDKIILFGSRAKKQSMPTSDYDLCILKSGISHRRKLAQLIYSNITGISVAVDIIVDTPEHFNVMKDNPFYIYHDIDREGVVVFDKASDDGRMVEAGKKQFGTGS